MQAMTVLPVTIRQFRTAIYSSALAAGVILLILLFSKTAMPGLRAVLKTIFFAFPLGAIGAYVYIWMAAWLSILGRVTRTNLAATLKALLIVTPLATVLSLAGIALGAPHDAQVWIFLAVILSSIFSDVAYVRARRYINRSN